MAVNPEIKKLTEKIRHTGPADQVRESIAGGMDLTSEEASTTRKLADQTENRQTKVESDFKTLQQEYTENGNGSQTTAEISLARDGEPVLADRLNRDFGNITAQFQQMAYIPKIKTGVDNGPIIQQLYDSIPSGGTLKIPAGIHEFSTPLLFNRKVNIDAVGSRLIYTGTDSSTTAVQIGREDEYISQIEVRALDVENKTTDWITNKIGIKIVNIYNSNFGLSFTNFYKGLVLEGINSIGNSYNKYFITIAYNNKKTITITSKDGGWANENIFYGGRFGWSSHQTTDDENVHVTIEYIDYSNNHNKFYGSSFEKASTGTGYAWKIEKGRYNYFRDCRYEGVKKVFIGEGSLYNELTSGYDSTALEIEDKGTGTFIQTPQRISYSLEGPMKFMNRAGVNLNVLEVLSPIDKAENFSVKGSGKLESSGLGSFVAGIRWYSKNSTERGIYHGDGTVASTAANPGSIYADIRGGYDGLFSKVTGTNSASGWKNIEVNNFGNSNQRPATPYPGQLYKDATIKKLIWWDGTHWLDSMGNIV